MDELHAITKVAGEAGLRVHMDGARFANALVKLDCSPAEMTWKVGVDIVSFGTTKNGTMNAEAVVVFDAETAAVVRYLHKRAGFLQSKMRFAAAQLTTYVRDNLWLDNARRANGNAERLARAFASTAGARLAHSVDANEIFVHLDAATLAKLEDCAIHLRRWPYSDNDLYRLVTAFCDSDSLLFRIETALAATQATAETD
ncbi:hypothetical protein AWV80_33885 [Cupriavidus sp. UYMU48A]|nr:hypothetical protein AWV80_33885 [Cupriavidus sp. UYMU48A]